MIQNSFCVMGEIVFNPPSCFFLFAGRTGHWTLKTLQQEPKGGLIIRQQKGRNSLKSPK